MIYSWEYKKFENNTNGFDQKAVFHVFSLMDNKVFGTTQFKIFDRGLLPENIVGNAEKKGVSPSDLDVTFTMSDGVSATTNRTVSICTPYTYCVKYRLKAFKGSQTVREGVSVNTEPDNCEEYGTYTSCKVYYFTDDDDDPIPGGGGGGGGGGNPGDPWDPSINPCPPPTVPATTICGEGGGWTGTDPTRNEFGYLYDRINTLTNALTQDPFFFTDPCNYLLQFRNIGTRLIPREVRDRVAQLNLSASDPLALQTITNAAGWVVNCDYFPIHITQLPTINGQPAGAEQLFDYFRKNFNSFIDNTIATFHPYASPADNIDDTQRWLSPNPLASLLHLDMVNDGTVIVSGFKQTPSECEMMVSTIRTPLDGIHPVSGNRIWGIKADPVNGGYTFYTTAVDRITSTLMDMGNDVMEWLPGVNSGFDDADALWRSLQDKMAQFIIDNGGQAQKYSGTPDVTFRPPFFVIEEYLVGHITWEQLKQFLGCP